MDITTMVINNNNRTICRWSHILCPDMKTLTVMADHKVMVKARSTCLEMMKENLNHFIKLSKNGDVSSIQWSDMSTRGLLVSVS
jgi:hypothetical protein